MYRVTCILCVLAAVACGGEPDGWRGEIIMLENGAALISSPVEGLWTPATAWRLDEDLVLGDAGLHRRRHCCTADIAGARALADQLVLLGRLDRAHPHRGLTHIDKLHAGQRLLELAAEVERDLVELDADPRLPWGELARFLDLKIFISSREGMVRKMIIKR